MTATRLLEGDATMPVPSALPGAGRVRDELARALGMPIGEVEPRRMHWRPGKSVRILYETSVAGSPACFVAGFGSGDPEFAAASPQARHLSEAVRARCASPSPIHALPALGALIEWYPASLDLPGLSAAGEATELVAYRPGQRAVMRTGDVYAKAYASAVRFARAVDGATMAGRIEGVRVAGSAGVSVRGRLALQRAVEGRPFPDTPAAVAVAGDVLARIHRSAIRPPRTIGVAGHLAAAGVAVDRLTIAAPALGSRLHAALAAAADAAPAEEQPVPSHGDFHDGQLLDAGGSVAVLDFDSIISAPPAFDLARFAAHRIGGPEDVGPGLARTTHLAEGYGRLPETLRWFLAVALLRRVTHPMRRLDPDWAPAGMRLADAAEAVMR